MNENAVLEIQGGEGTVDVPSGGASALLETHGCESYKPVSDGGGTASGHCHPLTLLHNRQSPSFFQEADTARSMER